MLSAIYSFTSKSCELAYDVHYICTVALWIGVWPNKIKSIRGVSSTWSLVMEQISNRDWQTHSNFNPVFLRVLEYPAPSIFLDCGLLSNGRAPYRFPALILPKDAIWGRIRKNCLKGSPLSMTNRVSGGGDLFSLSPLDIRPSCPAPCMEQSWPQAGLIFDLS